MTNQVSVSTDRLTRLTSNAPLLVTLLVTFDSLHFVFARLLLPHLSPMVSGFYMIGVATVEVGLYLWWRRQFQWKLLRQQLWFFLAVGLLVAGATVLSFNAVRFIDVGTASLLSRTAVLYSVGLGVFWLKDRLLPGELLGAVVALAGVFTISFQPGDFLRLGSLLVLTGSLCYALHAAVVKRYGDNLEFGNFFFFRLAATTFFLFFFAVSSPEFVWPSWSAWPILLVAATIDVVVSRFLYYMALRRLQMSNHAILLTLSPVIAIIWSILLFAEYPSLQGIVGGVFVIAGVMVMSYSRRKRNERTV